MAKVQESTRDRYWNNGEEREVTVTAFTILWKFKDQFVWAWVPGTKTIIRRRSRRQAIDKIKQLPRYRGIKPTIRKANPNWRIPTVG